MRIRSGAFRLVGRMARTASQGWGARWLPLCGIGLIGISAAGAASPPSDFHYVGAGVSNYNGGKGITGDYTNLAAAYKISGRRSVSGCAVCDEGGQASASVSLLTGTIRLSSAAWPDTHGAGRGGFGSAVASIGARIFLTGPAGVKGEVKIVTHVLGTFNDPNTGGDDGPGDYLSAVSIYVESGQSNDALGYRSPASGLIFSANNGVTSQLTCTHCRMPTEAPVPVDVTTTIPFSSGQPYVDFGANLLAESLGAATISVRVVGFSIKLPQGFSYTSTMKFLPG